MGFDQRVASGLDAPRSPAANTAVPGKSTLTERLASATGDYTPRAEPTSSGAPRSSPSRGASESVSISSLFGLHVVQTHAEAGGAPDPERVRETAGRGIRSPATSLPHATAIQRAFGPAHDVSHVQAHVGGAAADACRDMSASAYATGNHVAFASAPDLHTAAHEAAHVVQQARGVNLYGGVGSAGDVYERHADAVADRVVVGQSAKDLLSSGPGGGGWGSASVAVQRMGGSGPTPTPPATGSSIGAPPTGAPPTGTPPAAPPTPSLGGTVSQVEFTASHVMARSGTGPDARNNPIWTPGAVDHAAAYTVSAIPTVNARIALTAPAPTSGMGMLRARVGSTNVDAHATASGNTLTASLPLAGLPGSTAFGQQTFNIDWLASADGTTFNAVGTSAHTLYWLAGSPIGPFYSTAANRATGYAPLDGNPATALRHGVHRDVPYNPAGPFKTTELDALGMYDGAAYVCASFGNLLVVLARSVGLSASPIMYYGGIVEAGHPVWVSRAPDIATIHNVMPGNWTFTYHAFAVIGGVEHDAALDRIGIQADIIMQGQQVMVSDVSTATAPHAAQGTAYNHALERAAKPVGLQNQTRGGLITNSWFNLIVVPVPPGAPNPYPYPVGWSVTSGALPPGLTLHPATGVLAGTPTGAGDYDFAIKADATMGIMGTKLLHMVVDPPAGPAPGPAPTPRPGSPP